MNVTDSFDYCNRTRYYQVIIETIATILQQISQPDSIPKIIDTIIQKASELDDNSQVSKNFYQYKSFNPIYYFTLIAVTPLCISY